MSKYIRMTDSLQSVPPLTPCARVKTGDYAVYRPCFGMEPPVVVKITSLSRTEFPRERFEHGRECYEVPAEYIAYGRVVFTFDDNHWAYSDQIDGVFSARYEAEAFLEGMTARIMADKQEVAV
mgnify:CR=1 FL=1